MKSVLNAFRFAGRELRGAHGFGVFVACLTLGVAAIAGVGSVSSAFLYGLSAEGRALLGGDVEVELSHRPATAEERAYFEKAGTVSEVAQMRGMARATRTGERRLVELKAVDGRYPLFGEVVLEKTVEPGMGFQEALAKRGGRYGVVADPSILDRLGIGLGGTVRIGVTEFIVRATLREEPDRIAGTFRLGPRVFMPLAALPETGLVQPGSLIDYAYRIAMPGEKSDAEIAEWRRIARDSEFGADWSLRDRRNGAPGTARFIRQMSVFLTLVGLTALLVGGVGVGHAVSAYLDRKRAAIATFKCLGATGGMVFGIYLLQILALAAIGITLGLVIGASVPFAVDALMGAVVPVPAHLGIYPRVLALAAAYGVLVAIAFAVWPLARAREIPAAALFRDLVAKERRWPRPAYVALAAAALLLLAALAVTFTENRIFSAGFLVAAALSVVVLRGLAGLLMRLARAAGRPPISELRIALANLYRPGTPTAGVVLALGLGLTLLVTVVLIDGNFARQIEEQIPKRAPTFYFVDIQYDPSGARDQTRAFDKLVAGIDGVLSVERVPALRGRIVRIKGVPSDEANVGPQGRWAVRGDTSISYSAALPPNSTVVAGEWWPEDYSGPPLLSMDANLAEAFRVSVGDTITINIMGRNFEARLASTRQRAESTVGIYYWFVLSPGLLEGVPHMHVAAVRVTDAAEEKLYRAVTDAFPNVTVIRVKEVLETLYERLESLGLAVRGASGVTILAGIFVLAGAMAAGHRQRVYDAVMFKVLGATRWRVLTSYLLEYAILGLATAMLAAGAGTLVAWVVITQVMEAPWLFLPEPALITAGVAAAVTVLVGLIGTWRVLGRKAAPVLRTG